MARKIANMAEILQNLLSKADLLIVFIGMAVLLWRALAALSTLAHLLAGQQQLSGKPAVAPHAPDPAPAPVAAPAAKPAPAPPQPTELPVVDQALVEFIKKTEAFSARAYWDYKQWTNGYGTKANSESEVVDEAEALRRLMIEIDAAEKLVEKIAPTAPRGVKQALADLTFNVGPGWQSQGLGDLVREGNYADAKSRLLQYNHAGGQVLAGLTARREAEASWFDNPL